MSPSSVSLKRGRFFLLPFFLGFVAFFLLFFLFSCNKSDKKEAISCLSCHTTYKKNGVHLDESHQFTCTVCHGGNGHFLQQEKAHEALIAQPSHPDNWQLCAKCHQQAIDTLPNTIHYKLSPLVNLFRKEFGATEDVAGAQEISPSADPKNILELADDLLRRRCLRCHIFDNGDGYARTKHGTGCAACHSSYDVDGENKVSHNFSRPKDSNCLSCHYGNYVGADYYGRFEADYSREYHQQAEKVEERSYGVNYISLTPDIHQQKGMQCIDCHSGRELMFGGEKPRCSACHSAEELEDSLSGSLPKGVQFLRSGSWQFFDVEGQVHSLPIMKDKAHRYKKISCQVCHAQWAFNDKGKHFLRSDTDNYDLFAEISIQGNREVEDFITHNSDFENREYDPAMEDSLSGKKSGGIWYKSLSMRRWEVQTGYDSSGNLVVVRPLLDYQLSWIDDDDEVIFDSFLSKSLKKTKQSYDNTINYHTRPYTPHTTGKAGMFYMERILQKSLKDRGTSKKEG